MACVPAHFRGVHLDKQSGHADGDPKSMCKRSRRSIRKKELNGVRLLTTSAGDPQRAESRKGACQRSIVISYTPWEIKVGSWRYPPKVQRIRPWWRSSTRWKWEENAGIVILTTFKDYVNQDTERDSTWSRACHSKVQIALRKFRKSSCWRSKKS